MLDRNVDAIVGGFYGSEGKGGVVARIAPEYDVLIRVGGPNAGHTVVKDGNRHCFYHVPSGALHNERATLVLGPGANIHLPTLFKEVEAAESLGVDIKSRLCIDPQANIITEEDRTAEADVVASVGSTGQGVGRATAGRILQRGLGRTLARDCGELKPMLLRSLSIYEQAYRSGARMLLEGTQGTGLSLYHGPYPYTTSRDTTISGTAGEAGIAATRIDQAIVVLRSYVIRVASPEGGTSGPMYKELEWEDVAKTAGVDGPTLRERERTSTTKRLRRVGLFDWTLMSKALLLNGATSLALTFADYLDPANAEATSWDELVPGTRDFIRRIEAFGSVPVDFVSVSDRDVLDLRIRSLRAAE